MKNLVIIYNRIYSCFKEKKLLTFFYVIGFMLSVIVFIYVYNNFSPLHTYEARNDSVDRYYQIDIESSDRSIAEIIAYIEKYNPEYIEFTHYAENMHIKAFYQDQIQTRLAGGKIDISSYPADSILVPENSNELGYKPEQICIDGTELKVVGYTLFNNECVVSQEGFIQNGYSLNRIDILLKHVLADKQSEKFIRGLTNMLAVSNMRIPELHNDEKRQADIIILICITIGFMSVMIVFGLLIKYIASIRQRENGILRLVGGSRREVISIVLLEQLIINLVLSVAASIIHKCLFSTILEPLNIYRNIRMDFYGYSLICSITALSGFAIVMPHLVRMVFKCPLIYKEGSRI